MPNVRESGLAVRPLPAEGLLTGQATVTTTVTELVPQRVGRRTVLIISHGTTACFLGNSGVTATSGLKLAGVDGQGVVIPTDAAIFAVTASGSQVVSFMELF